MRVLILVTAVLFGLSIVSCKSKNDCEEGRKRNYPLPTDSVIVDYTGFDTLQFLVADSSGISLDTLTFYGMGTRQHWTFGPVNWCETPIHEETEAKAFKYRNREDSNRILFLVLTTQPEYLENSDVAISYATYIPNSESPVLPYEMHIGKEEFYSPYHDNYDTLEVLGKIYYNVRTMLTTEQPFTSVKFKNQKAYFSNLGGILKIIVEPNVVWLKMP